MRDLGEPDTRLGFFMMISPIASQTLINMLPAELSRRISVLDGDVKVPLPDWAASLIFLGAWCRSIQLAGKRLIVFAVLPARELAAAFASFGSLVAGAGVFEDSLSWPTFKKLPAGQSVFWIHRNTMARYGGEIVGFKEYEGSEFIVVKVTKAPRKAELGFNREISRAYFDDYRFTEEKPPSAPKIASFEAAWKSLKSLVENPNPKWIWADGAEALLVTSVAMFESAIAHLSLSIDGKPSIAISDLICLERNKEQSHSKLRIEHPRGVLEGVFPLAILDGAKAFMMHEHLALVTNLLVILDRSEYQEGIHDKVLGLRSISQDNDAYFQGSMPDRFAPSIELAAYLIDGQ